MERVAAVLRRAAADGAVALVTRLRVPARSAMRRPRWKAAHPGPYPRRRQAPRVRARFGL
ncbi:MAG: hypothetical protein ACLUW6_04865 [Coriobacteriaceae bacterium]